MSFSIGLHMYYIQGKKVCSLVKRSVALLSQQLCRIFSLQHCFTSVPILCTIPAEAHTIRSALTFRVLGIKCKYQNHITNRSVFNHCDKKLSIKSLVLIAWHILRWTRKSKRSKTAVDLSNKADPSSFSFILSDMQCKS